MAEINPKNWLEWHCGQKAQKHAVRLSLFCSSVLPSDGNLKHLVQEEIVGELIGLALHGRRTMEMQEKRSAVVGDDPLWPASQIPRTDLNLFDVFGVIIHAKKIEMNWETADLTPNPYQGRKPVYAANVTVTSDEKIQTLPIGAIAASYFGFQNKIVSPNETETT